MDDRYQNQKWFVKIWRLRYYLTIPFVAIRVYYREQIRELEDEDDWRMRFSDCWGLATGFAQIPMKWYYTWEEVIKDDNAFENDANVINNQKEN